MKYFNQKTKTILKSALIVAAFSLSISAMAVWTKPTDNPLNTNVATPINASVNPQMKPGALIVASFRDTGLAIFDGSVEVDGSIQVGNSYSGRDSEPSSINPAAALEINSTTQGILLPRMTRAQRDAISNPPAGLLIFQTDNNPGLRFYDGTRWNTYTPIEDSTRG